MSIPSVADEADRKRTARQKMPPLKITVDRLPPHSPEAETGVLGCCMMSPDECLDACEEAGMQPIWFYDLRHQLIWHHLSMMHKAGEAIDVITLQERMKK